MPHTLPIAMPSAVGTFASLKLPGTAATTRAKAKPGSNPTPITLPLLAESPPSTPPRFVATGPPAEGLLKTEFSSHLRTSFRQAPVDCTGELVRLLDDIAAATQCICAYVSHQGIPNSDQSVCEKIDVRMVTRMMYQTLCHDGYACMILERRHEVPFTFPETALHGGYVVMLTVLDTSDDSDDTACGTSFSIYPRRSSPSTRGRWKDLQQTVVSQVAAGYVLYSSTMHMVYTLGHGAFSFHMHPVAAQFFSFSDKPFLLSGGSKLDGTIVYADYTALRSTRRFDDAAFGMLSFIRRFGCKVFFNECFVENFDAAVQCAGVLLWYDVHLLCSAGPMALIVEQMGGKATNGCGTRILDLCVTDEKVHRTTTFLCGPKHIVDEIERMSASMIDIQ